MASSGWEGSGNRLEQAAGTRLDEAIAAVRSLKQAYAFDVNQTEWPDPARQERDRALWEDADARLASVVAALEAFGEEGLRAHAMARRMWERELEG